MVRKTACALLLLVALTGCSRAADAASGPGGTSARATLEAFFEAWEAKDQATLESLLSEGRMSPEWEFGSLSSVEFGPITEAPGEIPEYMRSGAGSVSGVAVEDVAIFRAAVTFHYKAGGPWAAQDGRAQDWKWILIRGDDGTWRVDDWGY